MKTRKQTIQKALLIATLCLLSNQIYATDWAGTLSSGTYELTTSGNGFVVNGGATVYDNIGNIYINNGNTITIDFSNSSPINIVGAIQVINGSLTMERTSSSTANPTLRKGATTGGYIVQKPSSSSTTCNLTIKGYDNTHRFVYHGGCDNYSISASGSFFEASSGGSLENTANFVSIQGGTANIKWVNFTNNWGGAMFISASASTNISTVNIDDSDFLKCYAHRTGAAMTVYSALDGSTVTLTRCKIEDCYAYAAVPTSGDGGVIRTFSGEHCGLKMVDCTLNRNYSRRCGIVLWNAAPAPPLWIEGCTLSNNWSRTSGAALAINGSLVLKNSLIINNHSTEGSGGGLDYGPPQPSTGLQNYHPTENSLSIDANTKFINNEAALDGGAINVGVYLVTNWQYYGIDTYTLNLSIDGPTISGNKAGRNGGAITFTCAEAASHYTKNLYLNSGSIYNNEATGNGGAIYASGGVPVNIGSTEGTLNMMANTAKNGGGIFIQNGDITMTNGNVGLEQFDYTDSNGVLHQNVSGENIANGGNGGGIYVDGGDISISGGHIDYNHANKSGNSGGNGGGLYVSGNSITFSFDGGTISNNIAENNGGGLFMPQTNLSLDFNSGTFSNNTAANGGGIYISEGATLNLKGTATLSGNHVPAAGKGGGIYMNGTLNVGGGTGTQSMRCNDNYAGTSYSLATQNNVYLPSRTKYITLKSDISHKTGGVYDTQIGITVNPTLGSGSIPVVYVENASDEPWLYALMADISTAGGAVFDDTQHYIAIHTRRNVGDFNRQFIYFADCWTTVVTTDPGESHIKLVGDTYHIYTNQGLAWFSSLVNGLNLGSAAPANTYGGPQPQLKAKLEADVDMSQNLWVPLGAITAYNSTSSTFTESATQGYTGEFDGQGHIIKGIRNGYLTGITRYGLFGSVGNGTVKNTFLDGYTNLAVNAGVYYMGGVSGTATGNAVISNSEARGAMDLTEGTGNNNAGGIVGNMAGTAKVHSCMAMPDILANNTRVGGIAGFMNPNTSVKNCFANGSYTRGSTDNCFIGGLVGINYGIVENCYSRLQGTEPNNFGWFAGRNGASISICYAPTDKTNYVHDGTGTLTGHGNYAATALVGGKYGYAHQDQEVTATNTYVENGAIDNQGELKGLLATLNNWVEAQPATAGYSTWTRTMASPINDDLPILEFDDFVSAGSTDNIFIAYRDDLNDMIDYANGNADGGSIYLYDVTPEVSESTNGNVRVYIDPNIGITQAANNTLNARVGIALDNSSTGFMAYDWHMFSSALRSAPMGLVYHSQETGYEGVSDYNVRINYENYAANGIPHTVYQNTTYMDPPKTTWDHTAGQIGYFPTDAPYGSWRGTPDSRGSFDFYCYHEPSRHWINFKREGKAGFFDHWNQYVYNPATDKHTQIQYTNESAMVSGKGYMVALSQPSMMMADGVLNNTATQSSNASYNEGSGYDQPLRGLNLVGNPYQSYLDFNQFANTNGIDTYYILDADAKGYIAYTSGSTPQQPSEWIGGLKRYTTTRYIHPHQGFFVWVDAVQTITFNSDMRKGGTNTNVDGESSSYRDWEPRYALVNMVCTDGEGRNDFATIELDRPEQGGGRKAKGLRSGDASIWFRLGDEDYQIAFAPVGTASAPLRFEAHADGAYTLRWNMQNADFSYLHLIDNLTGTDIDCLTTDEYRFEAKTSDYTSRFRLVFDFTGIDEPEVPEPVEGPTTFAFMMGDELVINGEGMLQMFDLNGRQLFSTEIHGSQATVAMPKVADGIYVLRLTNGNQVRTQKMVINK